MLLDINLHMVSKVVPHRQSSRRMRATVPLLASPYNHQNNHSQENKIIDKDNKSALIYLLTSESIFNGRLQRVFTL
jgi:hypothetical protein